MREALPAAKRRGKEILVEHADRIYKIVDDTRTAMKGNSNNSSVPSTLDQAPDINIQKLLDASILHSFGIPSFDVVRQRLCAATFQVFGSLEKADRILIAFVVGLIVRRVIQKARALENAATGAEEEEDDDDEVINREEGGEDQTGYSAVDVNKVD